MGHENVARLLNNKGGILQDAQKGRQQGHSERRAEEVQTALRVGRSPFQWILANGKAPPVLQTSEKLLLNVECLINARTPLAGFFSILPAGER